MSWLQQALTAFESAGIGYFHSLSVVQLGEACLLADQVDPENWRAVARAYQETCAKVIGRFEGHIAQYHGAGLPVYFFYFRAHEDDTQGRCGPGWG